ncbi:ankyrin repeat domain-containing protein, partial [Akkermansiaceae bacterium]|nr:ankyrin repeat domain-containing protein [Akkermansiaceae bacterium]
DEEDYPKIEGVFHSDGWTLDADGEIDWTALLEVVGRPKDACLVTKEDWETAQAENRVLSISHVGDGMQYAGAVGLRESEDNYCCAVVDRSMPNDIVVKNIRISDIEADFSAAIELVKNATQVLLGACSEGDLETVKQAISNGADICYTNHHDNQTPLRASISSGNLDIVRFLVDAGVDPESYETQDSWQFAVIEGHEEIAAFLSQRGFNQDAHKALLKACELGKEPIVSELAKMVSNINESGPDYENYPSNSSPLTIAAREGHDIIVKHLLELGADPLAPNSNGITPWVAAKSSGHSQIAELLETRGADRDSQKAFVLSVERGIIESAEMLLDSGADINGGANLGGGVVKALEVILTTDKIEVDDAEELSEEDLDKAKELQRNLMLEVLLTRGANPNVNCEEGEPVIFKAARSFDPLCLPQLIKNGACLEEVDTDGNTPLMVTNGLYLEAAGILLAHGANPNAVNRNGIPALLMMFYEHNVNVGFAKLMLAYGADLNATNPDGQSLKDLCEYTAQGFSLDDEFDEGANEDSIEQAREILDFLNDSDHLEKTVGLLSSINFQNDSLRQHSVDIFWEQLRFINHIDDQSTVFNSLVIDRVKGNSDEAFSLLEALFDNEDWEYRYAACLALGHATISPQDLVYFIDKAMEDYDEDVGFATIDLLNDISLDKEKKSGFTEVLNNSVSGDPESPKGRGRLKEGHLYAMLSTQADTDDRALEYLVLAVKLNPNVYPRWIWRNLASLRNSQGDAKLAVALGTYAFANEALEEHGDFDEYLKLLDESAAEESEFLMSKNDLAWALIDRDDELVDQQDVEKAIEIATDVCERDQWHYHGFLDTLATAYVKSGDRKKAIELLDKASEQTDEYDDKIEELRSVT